ncbi:MAG: DUF1385 domain-containing protein [Bryobacteraceae bacterium]|nr:DUF1385 domain-containing protein [Bryobacteraceae bacterium]
MTIGRFLRLSAHVQLMPVLESGEEILVGGQAVMEGVMMRAPHSYCVAVRKPDGTIVTETQPVQRMSEKYPLFRYPVLRGVGTLGQAMSLGMRALKFSANAALEEEGAPRKAEVSSWMMGLNIAFSLGFFIFLYKFVPLVLASKIADVSPALSGRFAQNMVDGVIRIAIFLAFLFLISRMKDIRRVFEYHGAEHKVVFNYESGKPVTVENAQRFVTFHPRCGTSFLLVVMVISMVMYALLPFDGFGAKFASRVALLPLIAGLSYELIRFAARRQGSLLALIAAPGLWLQRITTQPPGDTAVEVAITALDGAMQLEKAQGGELVIA